MIHYLVKYKLKKTTMHRINTYAKTYLLKQCFTNFDTNPLVSNPLLVFVKKNIRYYCK